jgi:predicted RNase H-like HicB family nuclease
MKNFIKTDGAKTVGVNLAVYIIKQGDYYVSFCPALNLSTFGDTETTAKEGFEEALNIFFKETQKRALA